MFKWLLGFMLLVYLEWQVWFWASDFIGGLGVFFATIFAVMFGLKLFRQTTANMQRNQAEVLTGKASPALAQQIPRMVGALLAAVLFMLPGLLSDLLGAVLLLPMVQKRLAVHSERWVGQRMGAMGGFANMGVFGQMQQGPVGGQSPEDLKAMFDTFFASNTTTSNNASTIIDGHARDVTTDAKQVANKVANNQVGKSNVGDSHVAGHKQDSEGAQ